jgi:hypothetical protein
VKKETVAGVTAETIDLIGAGDPAAAKRLIVAVVPFEGQNWYIKLTGAATTIAKAKPAYDAFLASLHFATDGHTHDDHAGHAHASPQLLTSDEAAKLANFTAPTGWAEQPPRPMRAHTFATKAGDGAAEVVVVRLSGNNIGPLDANINQWRGQVGLPPLPKDQSPPPPVRPSATERRRRTTSPATPAASASPTPSSAPASGSSRSRAPPTRSPARCRRSRSSSAP